MDLLNGESMDVLQGLNFLVSKDQGTLYCSMCSCSKVVPCAFADSLLGTNNRSSNRSMHTTMGCAEAFFGLLHLDWVVLMVK